MNPCHSVLCAALSTFPLNEWYVAGFSWELPHPVVRTLLGQPLMLFRTVDGQVAALEDRCCCRELPLSCASIEARGLRCGYHSLLFDRGGQCLEISGRAHIPAKARVRAFDLRERDQILWIWMGSTPDAHTCVCMAFVTAIESAPWAGKAQLYMDGENGKPQLDLAGLLGPVQPGPHLYVCSPKGFMDAVLDVTSIAGWSPQQLHWEFFTGEEISHEADHGVEVVLVQLGQTVVQALESIGGCVPTSCKQGVHGTCLTQVQAGEPEHHDLYLTETEQAASDQFMPCCSRA